jgi:hypothetical protein
MSYRHLPVTKRVGGKVKRYKNLASFNRECGARRGNICHLVNLRCTKDGGGLATVRSNYPGDPGIFHRGAKPSGTWLLHFADCGIMKSHLRKRVTHSGQLGSARRRKRRSRR